MENAYELYFHRLFSINPYRSLRMKLCEMSFCKDWPHTDRGEPYPIVRKVGAALGEKVEDGRIAFSADEPGERARLIGRFFPYASSEVCVDALDGEGARVGLEFAARAGRRSSPCTPESMHEELDSAAKSGSPCASEDVREGLESAARGGSPCAPEVVREGLESAARGGSTCAPEVVREGLEAAARGGSTCAPEGVREGLESAARSGSTCMPEGVREGLESGARCGSAYTAEDAPGLCVFVERAGAEVCVCHEEFVGGRSLGVVRHGTRAFAPGDVLFVSAHGAFFDVSLGREFVCTIQAEGFSDICRRSAFMNAGVSLYAGLPAGGHAAVSRAESFLDGGLSHADMKPVRYEDGTPILENGRLFLTLSSRLQAGAYQYVVSWNPSTCELRPEGAIFFDYGDGRWCADVAISLIYHRERREWLFWATAFSHGHILCHGTSAGDPRFGITVLDATLMEAQKLGSDASNNALPTQTSGAEMADGLAQTKNCACEKAGAARAFASDEVLSVQTDGRGAEMADGLARTKDCACGKAGAARASASDDALSVQAGGRAAEMADGLARTKDCACGKAGAARAFASDDALSAQAGGRGASVAELDDDTLWLAKTGDEDPDFTYDRARGKWYMTICRSVKGAGYRYFLFESDEPFSGYRHVCHTESGENTGGLMVCIRGRRALVCGSDFKARAEYRVYPLGDFSHFQRLTCDFDDGGFRGWGSLMPVPCGNRTKYVWMTFDRHNGSDYNWSYGNLYAYEAEEMDFQ